MPRNSLEREKNTCAGYEIKQSGVSPDWISAADTHIRWLRFFATLHVFEWLQAGRTWFLGLQVILASRWIHRYSLCEWRGRSALVRSPHSTLMAHSALRTWTRPASPRGEGQPECGPRSGEVLGGEKLELLKLFSFLN